MSLHKAFGKTSTTRILKGLSDRIRTLEDAKTDLVRQTAEIDRIIDEIKVQSARIVNRNTPIASLPNELLAYIFDIVYSLSQPETGMQPRNACANLLCQIISHWRDIAVNYPRLWASIDITFDLPPEALVTYLQRSGTYPLNLYFSLKSDAQLPQMTDTTSILDSIIPHLNRWRCLSIASDSTSTLFEIIVAFQHLRAPLLREFELSFTGDFEAPPIPPPPRYTVFSGGTPALETIRFRDFSPSCCSVSSSALQSLRIQGLHPDMPLNNTDIRDMFNSLPSLQRLAVDAMVSDWDEPVAPIHLPSLRSLRIRDIPGEDPDIYFILSNFSAPLLESLILRYAEDADLVDFIHSATLNSPRFPSLRSLGLLNPSFEPDTYRRLIRALPTIHCFTVLFPPPRPCRGRFHTQTIAKILQEIDQDQNTLTPASSIPCQWPYLHTLTLVPSDMDSICKLVSARIEMEHPITKICLDASCFSSAELKRMEWLRERVQVEEIEYHVACRSLEGMADGFHE